MPELPEVQTTVDKIKKRVKGRRILAFAASWPRQVEPGVARVKRALTGKTIVDLTRRGKYLVFHLNDGHVFLVHLGMSGRLEWESGREPGPEHVRASWKLTGGDRLLFCDARKFGRIRWAGCLEDACAHLGMEPMDKTFSLARFRRALAGRNRQLKPLLLDQSVVAGLGNIYADETLFRAKLHPLRLSGSLSPDQIRRLHASIRTVLRQAVKRCGTSFDWVYPGGRMQTRLKAYGRTGLPCPRCRTPIRRILVGQRSTHFCPRCQRK
jgi:formamidopyrimidine-DNA glycosylase